MAADTDDPEDGRILHETNSGDSTKPFHPVTPNWNSDPSNERVTDEKDRGDILRQQPAKPTSRLLDDHGYPNLPPISDYTTVVFPSSPPSIRPPARYRHEDDRMLMNLNSTSSPYGYRSLQATEGVGGIGSSPHLNNSRYYGYDHGLRGSPREATKENLPFQPTARDSKIHADIIAASCGLDLHIPQSNPHTYNPRTGRIDGIRKRGMDSTELSNIKRRKGHDGNAVASSDLVDRSLPQGRPAMESIDPSIPPHYHDELMLRWQKAFLPTQPVSQDTNYAAKDSRPEIRRDSVSSRVRNDAQLKVQVLAKSPNNIDPFLANQLPTGESRVPSLGRSIGGEESHDTKISCAIASSATKAFDYTGLPTPRGTDVLPDPQHLSTTILKQCRFTFAELASYKNDSLGELISSQNEKWDALLEATSRALSESDSHRKESTQSDKQVNMNQVLDTYAGDTSGEDEPSLNGIQDSDYEELRSRSSSLDLTEYDSDDLYFVDLKSRVQANAKAKAGKKTGTKTRPKDKPKPKATRRAALSTPSTSRRTSSRIRHRSLSQSQTGTPVPPFATRPEPINATASTTGRLRSGKEFTSGGLHWPA